MEDRKYEVSKRPIIYVAGPLKPRDGKDRSFHIAIADTHGRQLYKITKGQCDIFVPHNCHPRWEDYGIDDYEYFISFDLRMLKMCAAIYMLPLWNQSKGALVEHSFAVHNDIEVFYDMSMLKLWFEKEVMEKDADPDKVGKMEM